jgi:hypothetical protein
MRFFIGEPDRRKDARASVELQERARLNLAGPGDVDGMRRTGQFDNFGEFSCALASPIGFFRWREPPYLSNEWQRGYLAFDGTLLRCLP